MAEKNPLSIFSTRKILLPILIGVGVAGFLIWRDMRNDGDVLAEIIRNWTWQASGFLVLAMCFGIMRDLMYMYRLRLLSDKKLLSEALHWLSLLFRWKAFPSDAVRQS